MHNFFSLYCLCSKIYLTHLNYTLAFIFSIYLTWFDFDEHNFEKYFYYFTIFLKTYCFYKKIFLPYVLCFYNFATKLRANSSSGGFVNLMTIALEKNKAGNSKQNIMWKIFNKKFNYEILLLFFFSYLTALKIFFVI